MNKVNHILTNNIKSGLVRDLDEEVWAEAHAQAVEELTEELPHNPTDRELSNRALEILSRRK